MRKLPLLISLVTPCLTAQSLLDEDGAILAATGRLGEGAMAITAGRVVQGVRVQWEVSLGPNWTLLPQADLVQNTGGSLYPAAPGSSGVIIRDLPGTASRLIWACAGILIGPLS